MHIYLDNAATTPIDIEVFDAMTPYLKNYFGNPSSIHAPGRIARVAIENARKTIADILNASPAEIFFTSGGTEANNMAIRQAIEDYGILTAITSPTEHHAVLHTLEAMSDKGKIKLLFVNVDSQGKPDMNHLQTLLEQNPSSLVSLMHANNETGTKIDLEETANIVREYQGVLHSDTVQTMGHYAFNLKELKVDFINASAHKFHGPKGIGFIYIHPERRIKPFIYGGSQERNMRGGTENIYGIIGLAKAMEIAYRELDAHQKYIRGLKNEMIRILREQIPGVEFNGDISGDSLYTVLNVSFPSSEAGEMLLFNLDINGIAASGGSACSSGSDAGSHVLKALKADPSRTSVRFSFSKYNTAEEINYTVKKLQELLQPISVS